MPKRITQMKINLDFKTVPKGGATATSNLKGQVDVTIAGTWKYDNPTLQITTYYVFRTDGTYDYYPGYNRTRVVAETQI